MMIRFFADVDEPTAISSYAVALCDALVVVGAAEGYPVRLVPSGAVGALSNQDGSPTASPWAHHQQLLVTPLDPQFVNVVCTRSRWWPVFWTKGARNVLVACAVGSGDVDASKRYDAVIVPDSHLADVYQRPDRPTVVIDQGSRLRVLRDVIFGGA